jgi:hypothetical protein
MELSSMPCLKSSQRGKMLVSDGVKRIAWRSR